VQLPGEGGQALPGAVVQVALDLAGGTINEAAVFAGLLRI
jgi:hypothetical protein